jgi:transaldolase
MRSWEQVKTLAGVDVFTMPVKVARGAAENLSAGDLSDNRNPDLKVELYEEVNREEVKIDKVYTVTEEVKLFAENINHEPPADSGELVQRARDMGCRDIFPELTEAELHHIERDGKIPDHRRWSDKILSNEIAVDALLNLAGLATFAADQRALDDRIRGLL